MGRRQGSRPQSPERRRGYEKAGRAIRLATEIRALREARGLSQRELAERVGATSSASAILSKVHEAHAQLGAAVALPAMEW